MLKVSPIPAFKDNYIWLISHSSQHNCIVVDPGDATPVIQTLQEFNLNLAAILITHHHNDHSGGIKALTAITNNLPIYGPLHEDIPGLTHRVKEGDSIAFEDFALTLHVLDIPGHTHGHIAYYGNGCVFSGDTLFAAGCGRLFEGTAAQMVASLAKLMALPDTTQVYCGHEYTLSNLQFALAVEPDNSHIIQRLALTEQQRSQALPTVPSLLALEKMTNPFLRVNEPAVKSAAEHYAGKTFSSAQEIFAALRQWKNNF